MDLAARNMEFILASYSVTLVMLLALTAIIVLRSKKHDRQLAQMEQARRKAKEKANDRAN